ncbi:LysR family transcriptional regulator [haloarchaeon 3A1-DGR]|nr:LysR family transcriptional regulator [haloarchaeon 3A1-DGR]
MSEDTKRSAEGTDYGEAILTADGIEFGQRDAALLRAIDRTGSVATASAELERSRARALTRIETLEEAFGTLVERTRGGSGGGGSRLTAAAETLLTRYDRLQAALTAAARVPETVLEGTVTDVDGELATAETPVGEVWALRGRAGVGDPVQLRIGADAVTLSATGEASDPNSTSARNRVRGTVTGVDPGETVRTVTVDVEGTTVTALVTAESASRLSLASGREVVVTWKATATRMVPLRSATDD